jgi:F-type H+-transporting ATPase subunit b
LEALGINLGFLIFQILAFVIVLLTLQAWVYKPMLNMMASRKKKIADSIEDARVAAEARADAEKEAARIIANAETEASNIVRAATDRAQAAAQEVKVAAEAEAAKAHQAVMAGAEQDRNRMLGDLRGQVAALAIAAAQKLVGESLDERRQHALIDEFFSGTKAGKLVLLEDARVKGQAAEVTSALPLNAEEQRCVKEDLLAQAGTQSVEFRVDPGILGGLVIKVGDKVLDGSVSGKLEELKQSLK